ncbi:MAG: helix-turn-helix transcriptional regulator [Desulfurivibrionaceae bacterium]
MNEQIFLSDKQVADRYGVGRGTIWRWVRSNSFPKPVKISPGCSRWPKAEIETHEKQKVEERG